MKSGVVETARQTLLLDADDTLWENNIYFERAISAFISFLDHREHSADEVRDRLNATERETIAERGYGTESFRFSLVRCFEQLSEARPSAKQHEHLMSLVDAIVEQEIELIEGVHAALLSLRERHRLMLVTKGDDAEQRQKLLASALYPLFDEVEVVREKTADAYSAIVSRHGLDRRKTWMIGNSPRSDINPALEAGLNAVLIPHASTWVLEQEEIAEASAGQQLLRLNRLGDLVQHL